MRIPLLISFLSTFSLTYPNHAFQESDNSAPVPAQSIVILGPENSRVEFVGTHVGDDPKPRLGGFKSFRGMVILDSSATNLQSIEMTFEIGSIWTEFDKLTSHLMNADFFEQQKFPQAVFRSTQIAAVGGDRCNVKGELNLHGQSAEISFPARFQISDKGLILSSEFLLDRTRFEMDKMTDGVEKDVSITFTVGVPDRSTLSENEKQTAPQAVPVSFRKGFLLSPQNSSVEFVGTHVGEKPDPRLGGFGNFKGVVLLDESGQSPESLGLEFEIGSIWTEFDKLTNHLLNPDFFDRDQFPVAKYRSTRISKNNDQDYTVEGELTMLGTTAALSFPARFLLGEQGLKVDSEFTLDRTQFGMTKMTQGVKPEVSIHFKVGQPDRNAKKSPGDKNDQSSKSTFDPPEIVKIYLPNMLQY